jgi:hypothetical protein
MERCTSLSKVHLQSTEPGTQEWCHGWVVCNWQIHLCSNRNGTIGGVPCFLIHLYSWHCLWEFKAHVFNILCLEFGGGGVLNGGGGFTVPLRQKNISSLMFHLLQGLVFFLQAGDLSKCFQWKDPLLTMLCLQALLHGTTCGATCQVILSGYGHWQWSHMAAVWCTLPQLCPGELSHPWW